MPEVEGEGAPVVTRRAFMANVVLSFAGLLGLGALGERFFEFLSPPAPPEREVEIQAASLASIPDGGGLVAHLPSGHVALMRTGDKVQAFSAVCTHLGCVVQFEPKGDQAWFCPCHHGSYGRDGHVISGPPPRGLPPIASVVRDGEVFVKLTIRPPSGVA
jgi:cytochrome b6-f complex iron-sulfur subunit